MHQCSQYVAFAAASSRGPEGGVTIVGLGAGTKNTRTVCVQLTSCDSEHRNQYSQPCSTVYEYVSTSMIGHVRNGCRAHSHYCTPSDKDTAEVCVEGGSRQGRGSYNPPCLSVHRAASVFEFLRCISRFWSIALDCTQTMLARSNKTANATAAASKYPTRDQRAKQRAKQSLTA